MNLTYHRRCRRAMKHLPVKSPTRSKASVNWEIEASDIHIGGLFADILSTRFAPPPDAFLSSSHTWEASQWLPILVLPYFFTLHLLRVNTVASLKQLTGCLFILGVSYAIW
ncbi:hypothetical protein SUGI_0274050 [Cryptomeria japonica]|nr:hypothetical protein SUGI_0274050 [Cryptomeria japonica]